MVIPDFDNDIERHVAGATVTHAGPYATIEVPQFRNSLSREFVDKWVVPFYRAGVFSGVDEFAAAMRLVAGDITPEVLTALLSEFNWRPRITAAYFAAILGESSVENHMGKLLLRSDVCFAGSGYCLAMARLNTSRSLDYLQRYLDHYLRYPDLHFDQGDAIAAVAYIDRLNGTDVISDFIKRWDAFTADKNSAWDLPTQIKRFNQQMAAIVRIADEIRS